MRKMIALIFFSVLVLFNSATYADEKDLIKSLEKLRSALDSGVTYEKYSSLIIDAKTELNIFENNLSEHNSNRTKDFIAKCKHAIFLFNAVNKSMGFGVNARDKQGMKLFNDLVVSAKEYMDNVYKAYNNIPK